MIHEEGETEEHVEDVEAVGVRHSVPRLAHQATEFDPQLPVSVYDPQGVPGGFCEFLQKIQL
jgi:hypothetical protein